MRTFRYTASIVLLVFLWLAVAKESTFTFIDPRKIVTYYLFSAIIYGLSNFHTLQVEEDIRLGYISKYLVKPISPYGTYFLSLFAQAFAEVVIKLALLIPIALFLGYHFAISPLELLLCVLMLFIIFFAMFSLYYGFSGLAFWFQAVDSMRMCVMFLFRFLSGIFVSLTFFPSWYQQISHFLPFEYMAFVPIQMLQGNLNLIDSLKALGVVSFWAIIFFSFQHFIWEKATHSYEATGI